MVIANVIAVFMLSGTLFIGALCHGSLIFAGQGLQQRSL